MPEIDVHKTSQPAVFLALFLGTAAVPGGITSTSPGPTLVPSATKSSPERTHVEVIAEIPAAKAVGRPTTAAEVAVGMIREMSLLGDNWDGEGGRAPLPTSVDQAVRFVFLLTNEIPVPEPMLMAAGTIGLYWNERGLYADLEFLGDGRITYFIERDPANRHKGVAGFDGRTVPAVFQALLPDNHGSLAA